MKTKVITNGGWILHHVVSADKRVPGSMNEFWGDFLIISPLGRFCYFDVEFGYDPDRNYREIYLPHRGAGLPEEVEFESYSE